MRIRSVEWDGQNRSHFAEHGRCSEREVEEVLFSKCHPARATTRESVRGQARINVIGCTCAGRHLLVVAQPKNAGVIRPITAFPLGNQQTQKYLAWRKTVKR